MSDSIKKWHEMNEKVNKGKRYKERKDADLCLKHCPKCISAACNDVAVEFRHYNAKDFLNLVFFNEPIPLLHTHNYGFQTATGRNIIETTKQYYYKYYNLKI